MARRRTNHRSAAGECRNSSLTTSHQGVSHRQEIPTSEHIFSTSSTFPRLHTDVALLDGDRPSRRARHGRRPARERRAWQLGRNGYFTFATVANGLIAQNVMPVHRGFAAFHAFGDVTATASDLDVMNDMLRIDARLASALHEGAVARKSLGYIH